MECFLIIPLVKLLRRAFTKGATAFNAGRAKDQVTDPANTELVQLKI